jgi:hypothetical protein
MDAWPPPWDNMVQAPAGEVPLPVGRAAWAPYVPSKDSLEWAQKGLQVIFLGLALCGLVLLFGSQGTRAVLRGAARKHAVQ